MLFIALLGYCVIFKKKRLYFLKFPIFCFGADLFFAEKIQDRNFQKPLGLRFPAEVREKGMRSKLPESVRSELSCKFCDNDEI